MTGEYYCLIAGLTDYSFADKNRRIALAEIREEITQELTKNDRAALELLYAYYDIQNIVNRIQKSSLPFNLLGNLDEAQVELEIEAEGTDDEPFETQLHSSTRLILDKIEGRNLDEDELQIPAEELEKRLYGNYYRLCASCKSGFIREWNETDRTIRNMIVSHRASELGIDPAPMMIGSYVEDKDFRYYDEVKAVLDTKDFVEREVKMDSLRWAIAEDLTEHNYFDISAVLAYLVKLNILYRWSALDKSIGEERFRAIVQSFTAHIHIE